jgi:geranylgeranyl transferase type-2 subunit alpha
LYGLFCSALLSEISSHETSDIGSIQDRLEEEYELVKNSFFTDPDDSSAWFYYSWLLGQTVAPVATHLNGSWPPANSRINIDRNGICSLPTAGKPIEKLEALPLLISFSKPVTGVHNQSVAVKVNGKDKLQLDWRPSLPSEKYCLRWTAQIMHQVLLEQLLENGNFTVDISIGESLGIESPDAQGIDSPSHWSFYVHAEEDSSPAELEENTSAESQGDMTQGHSQRVWQVEILDREIEMCRELLELESNR